MSEIADRHVAPLLLTVTQACEMLGGTARSTFYGLMNDGRIATVTVGKRRFVRPEALADFVDGLGSGEAR